jgi:biopolymer transport protein ExbD
MRLPTRTYPREIDFNMTPLIDVVFLLIIFFLVSSHLAQQETQLELNLPTAASGEPNPRTVGPRVTVNLLADGQMMLGSSPASPQEIAKRLRYERERTSDDLEVRIRGDRAVPYAVVEPILLACVDAGVWNVSFAVVEKTRPPN